MTEKNTEMRVEPPRICDTEIRCLRLPWTGDSSGLLKVLLRLARATQHAQTPVRTMKIPLPRPWQRMAPNGVYACAPRLIRAAVSMNLPGKMSIFHS
jgi:hypothetical protein